MSEEIRDPKVKAEQEIMRKLIEKPTFTGATPLERAVAMFMEADTFLKGQGIRIEVDSVDQVH